MNEGINMYSERHIPGWITYHFMGYENLLAVREIRNVFEHEVDGFGCRIVTVRGARMDADEPFDVIIRRIRDAEGPFYCSYLGESGGHDHDEEQ